MRVDLAGLAQGKEMLLFPITTQAFGDGGQVGLDPVIAQSGELLRVALALEHRVDDRQSGLSREIANDVS